MASKRAVNAVPDAQVEQVMAASRVLVAVSAQALEGIEEHVTPIQMRALIILASRGPMRLTELAQVLGVHPSNATRICDKLVTEALLDRRENPKNRRELALSLTTEGKRVVAAITRRRARGITKVLQAIPADRREQVVAAMSEFAAAGGESPDPALWTMGWTT